MDTAHWRGHMKTKRRRRCGKNGYVETHKHFTTDLYGPKDQNSSDVNISKGIAADLVILTEYAL